MHLEKEQLHELTVLILNKTQFQWENKDVTEITKELAEKYVQVSTQLSKEIKKLGSKGWDGISS